MFHITVPDLIIGAGGPYNLSGGPLTDTIVPGGRMGPKGPGASGQACGGRAEPPEFAWEQQHGLKLQFHLHFNAICICWDIVVWIIRFGMFSCV